MGATMFKQVFDGLKESALWQRCLAPFAEKFWPENDCAYCYFYRALCFGLIVGAILGVSIAVGFIVALHGLVAVFG